MKIKNGYIRIIKVSYYLRKVGQDKFSPSQEIALMKLDLHSGFFNHLAYLSQSINLGGSGFTRNDY